MIQNYYFDIRLNCFLTLEIYVTIPAHNTLTNYYSSYSIDNHHFSNLLLYYQQSKQTSLMHQVSFGEKPLYYSLGLNLLPELYHVQI